MGTTTALLTVDEFRELPDQEGQRMELIHGEVITTAAANFIHEIVKSRVIQALVRCIMRNPVAETFLGTTYRLDEYNAPQPDVSVLLQDRIDPTIKGLFPGAPDLAIEVVSSEKADELNAKIELYLKHGSKAVWVFYPNQRQVIVNRAGGQIIKLGQDQVLEDHEVLPGFGLPLQEIFAGL